MGFSTADRGTPLALITEAFAEDADAAAISHPSRLAVFSQWGRADRTTDMANPVRDELANAVRGHVDVLRCSIEDLQTARSAAPGVFSLLNAAAVFDVCMKG